MRRRRGRCAAAPTAAAGGCRDRRPAARAGAWCPSARSPVTTIGACTGCSRTAGSLFQRSTMRRRFCRISWSSPRVRMRPGRWRRASVSREAQRRRKGSSHQSSPKSSRPVVVMAAACRTSGCSETMERPSSPRPCPRAIILSAQGLRGGGVQGTGRHRTCNGGEWPHATQLERRSRTSQSTVERGAADEQRGAGSRRGRDDRGAGDGGRLPAQPRRPGHPARPRPADGGAPGPPPSGRRRAGGGRAGARPRPPAARGHRRGARRRPARAVRRALGERVAGIVGLHVEAKRYLVATERRTTAACSRTTAWSRCDARAAPCAEQEAAAFLAQPWAADAVTLRRADDSGKVEGLVVRDLASWVPLLQAVSRRAAAPGG